MSPPFFIFIISYSKEKINDRFVHLFEAFVHLHTICFFYIIKVTKQSGGNDETLFCGKPSLHRERI